MTNKHECSISRALYWVSIFIEHGYSVEDTQKELADQLGIRVQLSEDKDYIHIQIEGSNNLWSINKSVLPVLQDCILECVRVGSLASGDPAYVYVRKE